MQSRNLPHQVHQSQGNLVLDFYIKKNYMGRPVALIADPLSTSTTTIAQPGPGPDVTTTTTTLAPNTTTDFTTVVGIAPPPLPGSSSGPSGFSPIFTDRGRCLRAGADRQLRHVPHHPRLLHRLRLRGRGVLGLVIRESLRN